MDNRTNEPADRPTEQRPANQKVRHFLSMPGPPAAAARPRGPLVWCERQRQPEASWLWTILRAPPRFIKQSQSRAEAAAAAAWRRVESSAKSGVFFRESHAAGTRQAGNGAPGTPTRDGITNTHGGNVIFQLRIAQPSPDLAAHSSAPSGGREGAQEYVSFRAFCACSTADYGGGDQYSLGVVVVVSLFCRFPISNRRRGRGGQRPPSLFRTRMSRAARSVH